MEIFKRGQQIGIYQVQSLIKKNLYTETYRVEDADGNPFFMKVFVMKRLPEKLVNTKTGTVLEIEYCQIIKHGNIISFINKGIIESGEGICQYYVTNYLSGELLLEKLQREGRIDTGVSVGIFRDVLKALQFLHSCGLCHNDITPQNIMLPEVLNGTSELIDLGHISKKCNGKVPFDLSDLDTLYCANETFGGMFDEQSDIFSITAVFYTMLTGEAPWKIDYQESMSRTRKAILIKDKRKQESLDIDSLNVDDRIKAILLRGLAVSYEDRYLNVNQILADLDSESTTSISKHHKKVSDGESSMDTPSRRENESPNTVTFDVKKGGGNGFIDIAGMKELKSYLSTHVLFVIKDKEKARKYRLATPNGMLLYGPPGCGKTFVAEKFAEETGFNYILVKSSDLASSFVHGSQEKIAQLFKQAEKNAPVVICFDEFDALVPDRSNPSSQYTASEVNEFLSQLNNCSQRGIFVVGTTNRPDRIDPAVLRTGRIDKLVFVPLPDREARREMFLIHLKDRPFNPDAIDADKLAEMTEGYIASDIAFVVNDSAMVAAFTNQEITEELLETSVRNTRPSLRGDTLEIYDSIRNKMENTERTNLTIHRIGFT